MNIYAHVGVVSRGFIIGSIWRCVIVLAAMPATVIIL